MKEKRIPLRKCVGCGQMKPKAELIRVVRDNAGGVSLDPSGEAGRGAYICRQGDCLTQARKARRLEKAFSAPVAPEIYDALEVSLSKLQTEA